MEAMQTLNPADVWDMAQKAIVWLAGIGIVIDLTPGIKIQPVRWLIKQLGNLMNHDLKEQLNQLENDFIEHKVDSWRTEILSFQSSCINHERHTKEEFDHVIDTLAKYDKYIKDHKLTNGQVDVAHEYIVDIYKECMRTNDFALTKPEEKPYKQYECIRSKKEICSKGGSVCGSERGYSSTPRNH